MKRKLALILALLFIVGLFAGCGGSTGTNNGTNAGTNTGTNASTGTNAGTNTGSNSGAGAVTPPDESGSPVDDGPYKLAAGKYALDAEGFPAAKYEYELPISSTDERLTYWTVNWTPQYLPESGYAGVPTFYKMEEMTGVHIEYNLVASTSRQENLAIALASDELDDIIGQFNYYYNGGTMEQAIDDEFIVNLHDYRDYMPNYLWEIQNRSKGSTIKDTVFYRDDLWVAFFGLYSTPLYSTGYFLRQDWMDALGLGRAEDLQTFDQLHEVLVAFKNGYTNASPMMVYSSLELEPYGWLGFNTTPYSARLSYVRVKDGKVVFCGTDTDDKELMQLLNAWWNEGLIDPNYAAYTDNTEGTLSSRIANSQLGYCNFTPSDIASRESTCVDPNVEWAPVTRLRRTTDQTIYWGLNAKHTNYGSASISATCDNIELAVTWMDWNYSDFGADWMNWGPEGDSYEATIGDGVVGYLWYYNENGERRVTQWANEHPAGLAWLQDCHCYNELADAGIQMWERNYAYDGGDRFVRMFGIWNDAATDFYESRWNWPASINFSSEDTETINSLFGDVNTYFQENYMAFFEGSRSFQEWDAFQSAMSGMGLDQITAIYQQYYDAYAA